MASNKLLLNMLTLLFAVLFLAHSINAQESIQGFFVSAFDDMDPTTQPTPQTDTQPVADKEAEGLPFDIRALLGIAGSSSDNTDALLKLLIGEKSLSFFETRDFGPGSQSGFILDGSFHVSTEIGGEDNFNGILASINGYYASVNTMMIPSDDPNDPSVIVPDWSKAYLIVFSGGIETDKRFNNLAGLVEVGIVPMMLTQKEHKDNPLKIGRTAVELGKSLQVGAFLQGGYKFELDSTPSGQMGNAADESEEDPDSSLFRVKLAIEGNFELIDLPGDAGFISFVPEMYFWYDIANDEIYHRIGVRFEAPLKDGVNWFVGFHDGSGAPNFNQGEQFSTGLSLTF